MVSDARSYQVPQGTFEFFRPKPDGDIDPAGEAGWFLQRERERRGESLEEVGWACNIHPAHLHAIEAGDLTGLPARAEALEMIGAYAEYLRFDPEPLKQHYAQFLPKAPPAVAPRAKKSPQPLGSAKIIVMPYLRMARDQLSGAGGIVASVAGAVMLFGIAAWMMTPSGNDRIAAAPPAAPATEQTASAPEPLPQPGQGQVTTVSSISGITETPLDDTKSISSAADSAMAQVDSLAALIERETKGEIVAVPAPAPAPAPAVANVATATAEPASPVATPSASGSGKIYGAENADSRVVLTAVEEVWIRLEENGQVVLSQTLAAGDTVRVPNRPGMMVIARDGGRVTVTVDGVDKGTLGRRGEIVVGRSVDARSLTNG
jgi:cytoskeleton protein RodZ